MISSAAQVVDVRLDAGAHPRLKSSLWLKKAQFAYRAGITGGAGGDGRRQALKLTQQHGAQSSLTESFTPCASFNVTCQNIYCVKSRCLAQFFSLLPLLYHRF